MAQAFFQESSVLVLVFGILDSWANNKLTPPVGWCVVAVSFASYVVALFDGMVGFAGVSSVGFFITSHTDVGRGEVESMPVIYFVGAGIGVLLATLIAGIIRTTETRRDMRRQLMLPEQKEHDSDNYKQEPAAFVSAS